MDDDDYEDLMNMLEEDYTEYNCIDRKSHEKKEINTEQTNITTHEEKRIEYIRTRNYEQIAKKQYYESWRFAGIILFLISLYYHWSMGIWGGIFLGGWGWNEILKINILEKDMEQ